MTGADDRTVLIDASVFITLAEIEAVDLLGTLRGSVAVPDAVEGEITDDPAATRLNDEIEVESVEVLSTRAVLEKHAQKNALDTAAIHLGESGSVDDPTGDIALLALGLALDNCVLLTDDKPLRKTCKALGVQLSGTIGVVIRAVERDAIDPAEANQLVTAMDEVGARLSARLLRRAERLIDEAADSDG